MVDIDNLSKQKIMQLYQDIGIVMGFNVVINMFGGPKSYTQAEIIDFCKQSAKKMEEQTEEFMKDNDVSDDTVVEMD